MLYLLEHDARHSRRIRWILRFCQHSICIFVGLDRLIEIVKFVLEKIYCGGNNKLKTESYINSNAENRIVEISFSRVIDVSQLSHASHRPGSRYTARMYITIAFALSLSSTAKPKRKTVCDVTILASSLIFLSSISRCLIE